jgi:hypothetical protein
MAHGGMRMLYIYEASIRCTTKNCRVRKEIEYNDQAHRRGYAASGEVICLALFDLTDYLLLQYPCSPFLSDRF